MIRRVPYKICMRRNGGHDLSQKVFKYRWSLDTYTEINIYPINVFLRSILLQYDLILPGI